MLVQKQLDAAYFTICGVTKNGFPAAHGEPAIKHAISIEPRRGMAPLPCTVTARLCHCLEESATASGDDAGAEATCSKDKALISFPLLRSPAECRGECSQRD